MKFTPSPYICITKIVNGQPAGRQGAHFHKKIDAKMQYDAAKPPKYPYEYRANIIKELAKDVLNGDVDRSKYPKKNPLSYGKIPMPNINVYESTRNVKGACYTSK